MVALNHEYVIRLDDDQVQILIGEKNFPHEVQIMWEELKDNQPQMNDNNLYHHLVVKKEIIQFYMKNSRKSTWTNMNTKSLS